MLAFTFPGQGSQKPGMGEQWIAHDSWELVSEASEACGRSVEDLLLRADADELRQTRNSQLATFVLSMVTLDAVERTGLAPNYVAGHSLGEYSALCASGVLSYDDAVRLVAERGEAMQIAADEQEGAMAAVLGLDDEGKQEPGFDKVGGNGKPSSIRTVMSGQMGTLRSSPVPDPAPDQAAS